MRNGAHSQVPTDELSGDEDGEDGPDRLNAHGKQLLKIMKGFTCSC